eukprot:3525461-Ditylum_brightwellii.AAC.2
MEAQKLLETTIEAHRKKRFIVGCVVANDDSTLRAALCHSYEEQQQIIPMIGAKLRDTDKFPLDNLFLTLKADPIQYIKNIVKPFFDLLKTGKSALAIIKADCPYLNIYLDMVKQTQDKQMSEMTRAAKSLLEPFFDNHELCGEWCNQKLENEDQRKAATQH